MARDENRRAPLKTSIPLANWKLKLRENCYRKVKEDRARLIWKFRLNETDVEFGHDKELLKSTFEDIVADEFNKIRDISVDENSGTLTSLSETDDPVWEYEGLHTAYQGECEEILLEMQRIFYEDTRTPPATKETGVQVKTWEDEEDEFLARAVYEHMKLNDKQESNVVWCPICKQGELKDTHLLIICSLCEFKLNKADEVNLDLLRTRLAEAHAEHLDRGCRLKPKFCIEIRFGLNALYIECQGCNTLEVVI